MEEARQHPALTGEQKLFLAAYFAGLLLFLLGIVAQFALGGRILHISLAVFAWSKVATSVWVFIRPKAAVDNHSRPWVRILIALAWLAFALGISLPFIR